MTTSSARPRGPRTPSRTPAADGRREEPHPGVQADGQSTQGTREGDVAQGVPGEDLGPEHDEIADDAGEEGNGDAGEERALQEGLIEDVEQRGGNGRRHGQLPTGSRTTSRDVATRTRRPSRRRRRISDAARYAAKAVDVRKKPIG